MRRYDHMTGAEMWVSEFRLDGGYEWIVIDGFDPLGDCGRDEVDSGCCVDWGDAVAMASKLYDQLLEGLREDDI